MCPLSGIDAPGIACQVHGNGLFVADSANGRILSGMLQGIPATCNSPVFLVRIATIANPENPNVARGFWIATGTERTIRP